MSAFAGLIDLITDLVRRRVPTGTTIKEHPGLIDPAMLKQIAMSSPRLGVVIGYGGQGEVKQLEAGDAAVSLSFGAFFVVRAQGSVVNAGREAGAVAIEFAASLSRFAPAAGLPETAPDAGDERPGVLMVTPAAEIVVETDSTKELLAEHTLFHVVSWTHDLIIGQPGEYPGEAYGALTQVDWDRPGGAIVTMDGDTIADLGGDD